MKGKTKKTFWNVDCREPVHSLVVRRDDGITRRVAKREKADVASKNTPKGQVKCATSADMHTVVLKTEVATVKTSQLQLAEIATRSEADANRTRTYKRVAQARFGEVAQEATLAREDLPIVREQPA